MFTYVYPSYLPRVHIYRCYNKYLEFDKATATFETFQRVCLTEKSDSHLASSDEHRLPRNLDIELRGGLVHTLQGGDNVKIWGLVKTLAQELPRGMKYAGKGAGGGAGGIRDSAVHVLYVLASSVVLLHSDAQYRVRDGAASVCLGEKGQEGGEGSRGYLLDQSLRNIKSGEGIPRGVGGTLGVSDFSTAEMKQIGEIALSNLAFPLFISLLCPRIYGQELVKGVIVLSLFGGTEKSLDTTSGEGIGAAIRGKDDDLSELAAATHKMREFNVRRNIHVLIGGDPGLGKSQLLRGGASLCPRSVVVSAMSASNAGLTVAMHREGGETVLEAGALVLADGGVCFIDELDKGGSDAGVALLEAMEQQSVSIAKGGVCTTLRTKCSVIAACNFGVDSGAKGGGSTKLSSALLSRFDLIFVLRDKQDADLDERVFQHIVNDGRGEKRKRDENDQDEAGGVSSNGMSLKGSEDNMRTLSHKLRYMVKHLDSKLPRAFLRRYRYLDYARRYVHPYLSKQACKVLQRHYLLMRGAGQRPGAEHSFSGVSTRQLESLIRLAQARAKVELRSEVTEQDALEVVQLMQESWMGEGEEFGVKQGEKGAKGGVLSMPKQMKALASLMQREVEFRGGNNVFHRKEIAEYHARLRLTKELDVLIEAMRTECYLLLKGPKLYQLQIV